MAETKAFQPATARNALSALAMVAGHNSSIKGRLLVASGTTKGSIYVQGATVLSCRVNDQHNDANAALDVLLELESVTIDYAEEDPPADCEILMIPIAALLAERTGDSRFQPSTGDMLTQEVPALNLSALANAEDPEYVQMREQLQEKLAEINFDRRPAVEKEEEAANIESGLTDEQREMLQAVSRFSDAEAFAAADPLLAALETGLNPETMKAALEVPLDEKSFEESEVKLSEVFNEATLSEEQQSTLALVSRLSDREGFEHIDEDLAKQDLAIPESEMWMLTETARELTPEQQREQFEAQSGVAANEDAIVTVGAAAAAEMEAARRATLTDEERARLDEIEALEGDYAPLLPGTEKRSTKENQTGIIERDATLPGRFAYVERIERRQINWRKYAGPAVLVTLCLALVTVPAAMRATLMKKGDDSLTRNQVHNMIEDETANSTPYAAQQETQGNTGPVNTGSAGPQGAPDNESHVESGSDLAEARRLAEKGFDAAAETAYESYLSSNPESPKTRMELIRLYMKSKKWVKARQHAIYGVKAATTTEERLEFWALFKQSLTD